MLPRHRFIPQRKILQNAPGRRMPRMVREWASLYEAGFTLQRIAHDTGWRPGRVRQPAGTFSPSTVRVALLDWGVALRKSGGRGSAGRSILVRVADLERRIAELEKFWPRE